MKSRQEPPAEQAPCPPNDEIVRNSFTGALARSSLPRTGRAPLLDQGCPRLYGFLIPYELDLLIRKILMDAIFILLTLVLFASALAFVRLCERV